MVLEKWQLKMRAVSTWGMAESVRNLLQMMSVEGFVNASAQVVGRKLLPLQGRLCSIHGQAWRQSRGVVSQHKALLRWLECAQECLGLVRKKFHSYARVPFRHFRGSLHHRRRWAPLRLRSTLWALTWGQSEWSWLRHWPTRCPWICQCRSAPCEN